MKPLDQLTANELYDYTSEVYTTLSDATREYLTCKHRLSLSTANLEQIVGEAIISGDITGKNEKEREAFARQLFPESFENVDRAQEQLWNAEIDLQQAKFEEAYLAMAMKIFEFTTR